MKRNRLIRAAALVCLLLAHGFIFFSSPSVVQAAEKIFPARTFSNSATHVPQVRGIVIKYRRDSAVLKSLSVQHAGQNAAGLGFAKASEAATRRGVSLLFDKPLVTGSYLLRLSTSLPLVQLRQLIQEIAQDPAVEYVEPNSIRRATWIPNDPYFPSQWHLQSVTGGIQMPAAWDLATGSGVRIAVIDSGVTLHSDLTPNVIGGYDFISDPWTANDGNGRDSDPSDPGDGVTAEESYWYCGDSYQAQASSWHGTGVAGVVGAVTHNGNGVAGVAFGAKVVPVRVLGRCGGETSDIAEAAIWAAGGTVSGVPNNPYPARVINLSLNGRDVCSATEQAAIDTVRALGAVVVVSAGNQNDSTTNYAPANCRGVIAVASTTSAGGKAGFSNYGSTVGLAAPGTSVLSTANFGYMTPGPADFGYWDGTSLSAPQVSGVAALLLQQNPVFTPDQVAARLKLGSTPFPATCSGCGAGLLNAYGALVPPTFAAGTVFRFYNLLTGMHLFTAAPSERDAVLGTLPEYQYERAAFRVHAVTDGRDLPVYRFRNLNNGAYFFTIDEAEKNTVLTLPYFTLEGVAWWATSAGNPGLGTIPLHRFLHIATGSHFYSYSAEEVANVTKNLSSVYRYEGIAFYVWPLS